MKCPQCSYLGFDTGDRCKNCGYDFSLLPDEDVHASEAEGEYDINADLMLRDKDASAGRDPSSSRWVDAIDSGLSASNATEPIAAPRMTLADEPSTPAPLTRSALPLFPPAGPDDDEPLVRVPAVPRQPLAVRRAPDAPRMPSIAQLVRRQTPDRDHVLLFGEELDGSTDARVDASRAEELRPEPIDIEPTGEAPSEGVEALLPSGVRPRMVAALIDHAILLAIDLVVVYFTLRMAALAMSDWRMLPPAPLLAFLGLVKLAYFSAFTAVGGQTIGKMAAGIRVISVDADSLDIPRAMERAVAVLVSLITLGIGFLPALFGPGRRALHDRVARTRVVALPSA